MGGMLLGCFKNSKNEADNAIFRLKVYLKERGIYVSPITGVGGNSGVQLYLGLCRHDRFPATILVM